MTTKCETDKRSTNGSVQSPSVSVRMDAGSRRTAKKLHKLGYIYALYGALDGLSLSYSMFKYGFDLLYTDSNLSSSDMMHDWMMTPAGIAAAATESITLIGFSLLANLFNDDDKNAFKRFIAISWPYFRDTMKGLKNAYKGIRSTVQAYSMLLGQNARYLIVPVGLFLGVLSAVNRICMRKFVIEPRKNMMKANAELLLEIQGARCLHVRSEIPNNKVAYTNSYMLVKKRLYYVNHDGSIEKVTIDRFDEFQSTFKALNTNKKDSVRLSSSQLERLIKSNGGHATPAHFDAVMCRKFRERIGRQSVGLRSAALVGAAYGGVVDGLYLFMGAVALAALSSPFLLAMTVICTFFSATCIATRVYEEYDFQRKLAGTQVKIELALLGNELESLFARFQRLANPLFITSTDSLLSQQENVLLALESKLDEFNTKQVFLNAQVTLSYLSAALAGLKNGLAAYCAIASVMFASATIYAILLAPFPPAFLITCVIVGMACLIGFLTHALVTNYQHVHSQESKKCQEKGVASDLKLDKPKTLLDISILLKERRLSAKSAVTALEPTEVKEAILKGMVVDPSPQFFFQEWFEVVRSFFSGFAKGQKSVDYTLNALQEPDRMGHYQDTPVMLSLAVVSAVVHAGALSLRAYARGFGRPDISDVQGMSKPEPTTTNRPSNVNVRQIPHEQDAAEKELCKLTELGSLPVKDLLAASSEKGASPQRERPSSARNACVGSVVTRHSFLASTPPLKRSLSDNDLAVMRMPY